MNHGLRYIGKMTALPHVSIYTFARVNPDSNKNEFFQVEAGSLKEARKIVTLKAKSAATA